MQQQEQKQQQPATSEQQEAGLFSAAILKLAETYQLGEPLQEYQAQFPLNLHVGTIILTVGIWLCTLLLLFLNKASHSAFLWIVIALLATAFLWVITLLVHSWQRAKLYQRVYICTSGLLCQRLNKTTIEPIHWHHIETINYDVLGNCRIHRNDGVIFFFSPPLQNLGELIGQIEQAIIPYNLPQLLTSYRNGLPIVFGPLRINQQGIGLTQNNITLFAWDKIQGIERRFDHLQLRLHDNRLLRLPLTVHEIPSVSIAQALIRTILDTSEQATQELREPPGKARTTKGQRGQRTQKIAEPENATPAEGTLTTIMGDPLGSASSDKLSIVVYERGFLYLNKSAKKLDIIRWDQISQVLRRTHNSPKQIEYTITVTRNDNTVFLFPRTQPRISGIGLYIEQKAAEWALPGLIKQYDADETTAFGKLTINQAGITYHKQSLPWSEIYEVRILQPDSSSMKIKQRGISREWNFIAANKIPDAYLLKLLIDYILSTHASVQR